MGFLMGAYGKLMAGQRLRGLQFRLAQVTSRHRRITKEIEARTKMYEAQERNMKNVMQAQQQSLIMGGLMQLASREDAIGDIAKMQGAMFSGGQPGQFDMSKIDTQAQYAFSSYYSQIQQAAQMQSSMSMNMWKNAQEMMKEADLEALKDVEAELQTEKDSLESQIKIAENDYNSFKEMEKQGAQNLKPDFTGQGN